MAPEAAPGAVSTPSAKRIQSAPLHGQSLGKYAERRGERGWELQKSSFTWLPRKRGGPNLGGGLICPKVDRRGQQQGGAHVGGGVLA
jgi:hypothetical protein